MKARTLLIIYFSVMIPLAVALGLLWWKWHGMYFGGY